MHWHFATSSFVLHSGLFVDFFFVLSGFIICHAYSERIESGLHVASFMVRRFGRLWLLHAAVLTLWVAAEFVALLAPHLIGSAEPPFTDSRTPAALVANVLLIQALDVQYRLTWNASAWSISVEFWTYLVFALTCLTRQGIRNALNVALCRIGMAVLILAERYARDEYDYVFFRGLYGFFGVAVYRLTRGTFAPGARLSSAATIAATSSSATGAL